MQTYANYANDNTVLCRFKDGLRILNVLQAVECHTDAGQLESLLIFCTGSDTVPALGFDNIKLQKPNQKKSWWH